MPAFRHLVGPAARTLYAAASVFAAATLAAGGAAAAAAAEPVLTLQPAQVSALGLRTQRAEADATPAGAAATASAGARYPATVTIPASQQRVLAAALAGMVETLGASVGDTVRAGQVLATVRSAQAQDLQHDLHVARSQAALSETQLQRDEQLFKEGLIAASRLENTRMQAALAVEQREERALALAQAGGSAQGESNRLTLRSPITGVVLERPVVPGQRVDAATALFRVASLTPLWLEMQVPAAQAAAVRIGATVAVVTGTAAESGAALAAGAAGKVIAIGHAVDAASQTVLVRAEIRQPAPALRAGQAVEAVLMRDGPGPVREGPGLVRVPSAALLSEGTASWVYVDAGGGRYQAVPVEVVSSAGATSAVRGLAAGRAVVVQGLAALKAMRAAARP